MFLYSVVVGLDREGQQVLTQFYFKRASLLATTTTPVLAPADATVAGIGIPFNELLQRLPKDFDVSRVPEVVVEQFKNGQPIDILLLPADMLEQFIEHNADLAEHIREALRHAQEMVGGGDNC